LNAKVKESYGKVLEEDPTAMSCLLVTVLMQIKAIGFKHIHLLEPMDLFIYGSDMLEG
jgi:hypothetical protein